MAMSSLGRGPLGELAVEQLRAQLTAGTWPVGTRLPAETVLATQLGVGRSTVREAVRVLVAAGQLETRQGSGTFVRALEPSAEWVPRVRRAAVLDVYEVREALEVQAARLAAERRTAEDLDEIDRALSTREAARAAGEVEPFVDADLAFHGAVVAAAHNALLDEMFSSFLGVLREALVSVVHEVVIDEVDAADAHAALAAAIRAGDPDAAIAATHANVTVTGRSLRAAVPPGEARPTTTSASARPTAAPPGEAAPAPGAAPASPPASAAPAPPPVAPHPSAPLADPGPTTSDPSRSTRA